MIRSLVFKELRELRPVLICGLIGCFVLFGHATRQLVPEWLRSGPAPDSPPIFYDQRIAPPFLLLLAALAIAMGFLQSLNDTQRGTMLFLLHRPIRRHSIFLTKLLVGIATLWLLGGGVIVAIAIWASIPGNQPAPFYWRFTWWAWWLCLPASICLYAATFLAGLRVARWQGTRLLPILGAAALQVLALGVAQFTDWRIFGLLAAAIAVCLAACVLHVAAERDFN